MTLNLNGLTFKTLCGVWRTEYISQPTENGNNVDYWIRFKWVDPHDTENRETPERRLRLLLLHTQMAADDFDERFQGALMMWLDSDETDATFDYDSAQFRPRDRS